MSLNYIGVDGCRNGWFLVGIGDDSTFEVDLVAEFCAIRRRLDSAALILVDIPIGLPGAATTERYCDRAARKMISPRGSTVFPAPARSALYMDTYESASAENHRCLGRKLSQQSYRISGKIREVDEFLRTHRPGQRIREFHPEVAFCSLNNGSPILKTKKSVDGYRQRMALLQKLYPQAGAVVKAARRKEARKTYLADDDILDALAGAVTASHYPGLRTLPEDPAVDDEGLPMEMVYALARETLAV